MDKIIKYLYYLLVFSFVLPNGTFYNLPIKTLLCIILFALILVRSNKINDNITIKFFYIIVLLCFWSLLSIANGYTTYFSFIKSYFSLLVVVWITYELIKDKVISYKEASKSLAILSITIMIIKIVTSLSMTLGIFSYDGVILFYETYFNSGITTMYFMVGKFMCYRIMIANDFIPYVFFSFYLFSKGKRVKKILLVLMMSIFTFIVFSRFVILQFLVLFAISAICCFKGNKHYFKNNKVIICCAAIIAIILVSVVISKTNIIEALIFRFKGNSTVESDSIRDVQTFELITGIKDSLFFGHGTGSYLFNYTRSSVTPYSYEKEYLSYIYQFGVFGFCLIIMPTIFFFYKICVSNLKNKYVKYIAIANFLIWAIRPFFNPGFISSNSGIIIVSIYVFSKLLDNKISEKELIVKYAQILRWL